MLENFGIAYVSAGLPTEKQRQTSAKGSRLVANVRVDFTNGLHISGIRVYRRGEGEGDVFLQIPSSQENQQGKSMDYMVIPEEMQKAIVAEVLIREGRGELFDRDREDNKYEYKKPFVGFKSFSVESIREFVREQRAKATGRA